MTESDHQHNPDRRAFLKRTLAASAASAAALTSAAFLLDPADQLVTADSPTEPSVELPSFAVDRSATAPRLAVARGSDDPLDLLDPALKALGNLETFIKPGDIVVIKPNIAFASPPLIGATTDPDLVAAVVRRTLAAGASRVIVTDNPINQPDRCFTQTGIGPAARAAGAELFIPTDSDFAPITVPDSSLIRNWPFLAQPFLAAHKVIGITPVKDHARALASMSLKNWYGLLGGRRNQFHQDIHNIIKELALMIAPTLVILDGTRVMMRNGPTGGSLSDLAPGRTLIAATDPVAADAVGYTLLNRNPHDLPYLRKATDLDLGNYRYQDIPHVEFNI